MKSLWFVTITVFVATFGFAAASGLRGSGLQVFQEENVLGTSFELKVAAMSPEVAARAKTAALNEIVRESVILSSWDAGSEFSRWSRTQRQTVVISPEL